MGEYEKKSNPSSSRTETQYYTLKFYTSSISTISDETSILTQTDLHFKPFSTDRNMTLYSMIEPGPDSRVLTKSRIYTAY